MVVVNWKLKNHNGIGYLVTKAGIDKDTPGAVEFPPVTVAGTEFPGYWGLPLRSVSGSLVWLDVSATNFKGAVGYQLNIFLKEKERINQISFDATNCGKLRDVCNRLAPIREGIGSRHLSFSNFIYDKEKGGQKVVKDGKVVKASTITLKINGQNATKLYEKMPESLNWIEIVVSGKKIYDSTEEQRFWHRLIIAIQKELIDTGVAMPFLKDSVICGEDDSPMKEKQATPYIAKAQELAKGMKGKITFFGSTSISGADSSDLADDFFNKAAAAAKYTEVEPDFTLPDEAVTDEDLPF